ncbi:MAG: peptide chain release factor N(5)-glutamine methyltransferase [Bacteroidetes bacterium]|nr:peptide chain release factor N(5)-glutamine methyltransferase [Bacteroidota bacterium]
MEVKSNRIGDIRSHYKLKLHNFYEERETDNLLFMLFEEFANLPKSKVLSEPFKTISESELLKVHFAVKDLTNYKPIQYIIGKTEFYGIILNVNPDVLIPRPETEELVEIAIKSGKFLKNPVILDIGTGSGCIAIALKKNIPDAKVSAVDVSLAAIRTAKTNARQNQADIQFIRQDILKRDSWNIHGLYDIIISNPPYVRTSEKDQMKKNVLNYEPAIALFADENDPLLFYRAIADFSANYLSDSGSVYCEVNQYLGKETAEVFQEKGLKSVLKNDLQGNPRFVIARRHTAKNQVSEKISL